jgi:hypothetical protein
MCSPSTKENYQSRSDRVDEMIRLVDGRLGLPDIPLSATSFVIMDENILFLSLLATAFTHCDRSGAVYEFTGRKCVRVREAILRNRHQARGPRILLASRAIGGVGLNLQGANMFIACTPRWKELVELQAVGRTD